MKSLLIVMLLIQHCTYAQVKLSDCRFSKFANYESNDANIDTVIIRAKYHSISKPWVFPMLDTLNKKGLLKRSDYRSAIVLWQKNCAERVVPLYTTNWYPDARFDTKKYHGKEYNFTCVFYKGYSDQKDDFFVVLSMNEIKK